MRGWLDVPGIRRASARDLEELERIAVGCGFDPDELAAIISVESGWRPDSHNSIGAGGLIGFLPSTLARLGWQGTPEEFWRLSIAQQLPYVAAFYQTWCGRIHRSGDLYLATFWPEAVGASDDTIIAAENGPHRIVWQQNPGLRGPDGAITAGSVRAVVLRVMERAAARARYLPGLGTTQEAVQGASALMLVLAGILAWRYRRITRRRLPPRT
jgi:hypothetical protein